jgi:hypothetical protein
MSAIESCRTAALGGYFARCEDCAHTTIAYNSCLMGKFRNGELATRCIGGREILEICLSITDRSLGRQSAVGVPKCEGHQALTSKMGSHRPRSSRPWAMAEVRFSPTPDIADRPGKMLWFVAPQLLSEELLSDAEQLFPLHSVSKTAVAVLFSAAATLLIPVVVLWVTPGVPGALRALVSIAALGFAALFVRFATTRSYLAVRPDRIILRIPVYGRSISFDRVILQSLTRLTIKESQGYRLKWRTNGLSVPGYQLGWFRTTSEGRVLAAISADDLVAFKTLDDFSIIVSAEDCDSLIAVLRDHLRKSQALN